MNTKILPLALMLTAAWGSASAAYNGDIATEISTAHSVRNAAGTDGQLVQFSKADGSVFGSKEEVQIVVTLGEGLGGFTSIRYTLSGHKADNFKDVTEAGSSPEGVVFTADVDANSHSAVISIKPEHRVQLNQKSITLNVCAGSSSNPIVASATYIFDDALKPSGGADGNMFKLVTDPSTLKTGDSVMIAAYRKDNNKIYAMSKSYGTNASATPVINYFGSVMVTLTGQNTIDCIEEKPNSEVFVLTKYDNLGENVFAFKTTKADLKNKPEKAYLSVLENNLLLSSISPSNAKLQIKPASGSSVNPGDMVIKDCQKEVYIFAYNINSLPQFTCYNSSYLKTNCSRPRIYVKQAAASTAEPVEDLFLVMDINEWDGYNKEVAVPFEYKGNGKYTLDISRIPASGWHNIESGWVDVCNGFAGEFYIRDGKADNSGLVFSPAQAAANVSSYAAASANNTMFLPETTYNIEASTGMPTNKFRTACRMSNNEVVPGNYTQGTIELSYVPGSKAAASMIVKNPTVTGLSSISPDVDDIDVVYFDLQGRRVNSSKLAPGIYIKSCSGQTTKVHIR